MSSDASVLFIYNGAQTTIQCMKTDKMRNIFEKYNSKLDLDKTKNYYYLYDGNKIDEELTYEEIINDIDKNENKIKILVIEENKNIKNENIEELNEIICPECGENILIKLEEYKINLYKCKNNHNIDLLINELDKILKIDITKIECNECKEINKGNAYNKEFYKCITCNKNLCPLCKYKHDKKHIIIEYNKRNIICNIHNDFYIKYCKNCNKNICFECIKEHENHNLIDYCDIIHNDKNNNEIKEYIDKLDNIIDDIIKKLENIKDNMKVYYNISNNIINNNNRNYEILNNINEFINNNNKIIIDIKEIMNNNNNINDKFEKIMNIYDKINKYNNIIGEIDIKDEDINKDIRIINSFEEYRRNNDWDGKNENEYENEKEIKENCEIKINGKKIPFCYFYKFDKIGKYEIIYTFKNKLNQMDFMFSECDSLTNIDLSDFNTRNVTNMSYMFSWCKYLTDIKISNINTQNVTNMSYMFYYCRSLKNLDLSNFNTQNVSNMSSMFNKCKSLTSINLSNFNNQNETDMSNMFSGCDSLKKENIIVKNNKILNLIE